MYTIIKVYILLSEITFLHLVTKQDTSFGSRLCKKKTMKNAKNILFFSGLQHLHATAQQVEANDFLSHWHKTLIHCYNTVCKNCYKWLHSQQLDKAACC